MQKGECQFQSIHVKSPINLSGSSNKIKWFEKEKIFFVYNKSETYNHRRYVACGHFIGLIWVFVECDLRYLLENKVTYV